LAFDSCRRCAIFASGCFMLRLLCASRAVVRRLRLLCSAVAFRSSLLRLLQQEDLNFLLTNRIPRRLLTHAMGWISPIEQPLVRDASLWLYRWFAAPDLSDAARTQFRSLHDCFVRELRPGARPIDQDPGVMVSPCDAIVGAVGRVAQGELIQAKGFPYTLRDLLVDDALAQAFRDGCYVTLRIKAGMYHRFHAPHDCSVDQVTYVSGDTWNVNPITLRRVERLFCRNERAVLRTRLDRTGHTIALVPVAAVLVASIRLHFVDVLLHLGYRGSNVIACRAALRKGDEMGWFQHGSTILVFAPRGFTPCDHVQEGRAIRVGQPLLRLP
jgi:phosphatidylserine decarboxylase